MSLQITQEIGTMNLFKQRRVDVRVIVKLSENKLYETRHVWYGNLKKSLILQANCLYVLKAYK